MTKTGEIKLLSLKKNDITKRMHMKLKPIGFKKNTKRQN
jgi:hypothetical protein